MTQTKPKPKPKAEPKQGDFEKMAATTEAHDRFKPFVGKFRAEVKIWMGPGEPMASTGTMVNDLDLGGRYLRQTYQGDAGGAGDAGGGPFPDFEGRGFWGFNKVTGKYEGFWIDTASTIMQTEAGDVDASGKVWTMRGEMANAMGGPPVKKKSVITLRDRDHHSLEMFFDGPDGRETKGMLIQYTRST